MTDDVPRDGAACRGPRHLAAVHPVSGPHQPQPAPRAPALSVLWLEGELPLVLASPLRAGLRRIRAWRRVVVKADREDGAA